MLTLLFVILMIWVFGKLIFWSIKAAWGITRILLTLVFLPLTLIGMVLGGLMSLALPILVIIGLISLFIPKIH